MMRDVVRCNIIHLAYRLIFDTTLAVDLNENFVALDEGVLQATVLSSRLFLSPCGTDVFHSYRNSAVPVFCWCRHFFYIRYIR